MCKTRILFLGLFSAICITGNAYSLDYNNPTIFLNNNTKAEYQLAKSTFLPDSFDDLGLSGHENTKYDHNQGDNCSGYDLTTCPAHGNCLSCSFNRKLKRLVSCASGYTRSGNTCSASSCSAAGYESSIPANKICTKFTEGSLTCYKDCRTVSCSAYTLNCDTFNVANSSGKTMCPDCESANASCSPKLCKVSGCQDGYKIASNGTTCVALDDTCPVNTFKAGVCETGEDKQVDTTEAGTPCYSCKAKPVTNTPLILYSDMTTSKDIISGKTAIGIVFDEVNKKAVALDELSGGSDTLWSTTSFNIPNLPNYNYYIASEKEQAIASTEGKKFTKIIIDYCTANGKTCPAASKAYNYTTAGTIVGDWYLGDLNSFQKIDNNRTAINEKIKALGKTEIKDCRYGTSLEARYLDELNDAYWAYVMSDSSFMSSFQKDKFYLCVRPMINYGEVKPAIILPILYSDMTTSTRIDTSKTPIGIVIDELRHVAMALETTPPSSWSKIAHGSISGVFSTNDPAEALSDMNGLTNTSNLAAYCFSGASKQCSSLQDVLGYSTEGTEPGDWYFSSLGELSQIYQLKDAVNATLALVGYPPLENTWYWSSTRSDEGYSKDGSWYIHFDQYDGMPQRTNFATVMSKIPLIKYPTGMDLMCAQLSYNNRARFCGGIDPYQGNVGNYPYCIPTTATSGSTTYAGAMNNGHTCWLCDTGYRVYCHTNSPSVQYCDAYENGECIACYNGTLTDGKCK